MMNFQRFVNDGAATEFKFQILSLKLANTNWVADRMNFKHTHRLNTTKLETERKGAETD